MENETQVSAKTEFIKVLPPLIWVIFAIITFITLYGPIRDFALAVSFRVKSGAQAEIGPLKLAEIKIDPQKISSPPSSSISLSVDESLERKRRNIYEQNKYFFIAHRLYPSKEVGQTYDIWIYIVPHKKGIEEIKSVSYFFGPTWGNTVYTSIDRGKSFGVVVSAYGPMLTYVTINLNNGEKIETWSYIDFENGSLGSRGGV